MTTWRLIIDGPIDGAWNMAVDWAVLHARQAGDAPPTLRLYRWKRPTVSLGRFQPASDVDVALCERRGVAVCRRPTGGRGVLHDDELTYAAIMGADDGLPRGVSASYRALSGALVAAYRHLGVPAELTSRPRGSPGAAACYLHATGADVSLGAAKLSGSAQIWHRDTCLQHGSFVLSRDTELEAAAFRLDSEGERALARGTRTLSEALGRRPSDATLARAVVYGFTEALGASFEEGVLTSGELAAAEQAVASFRVVCGP